MAVNSFKWRFLKPSTWPTWLGFLLMRVLAQLPYSVLMWLGRGLGNVMYWLFKRRVHIADVNLQLCFPSWSAERREQVTRGSFQSMGMGAMEAAMAWYAPKQRWLKRCKVSGLEHVQTWLDQGYGVIIASYHTTCLELAAQLIAAHLPNDLVAYDQRNRAAAYLLTKARTRFVKQVISSDDVRAMFKVLRRGGVSMTYAFDHALGPERSVLVNFFAEPAATIKGVSRLCQGKVKMIPAEFFRDENGQYQLIFSEALQDFPSEDETADARRMNALIEPCIERHPEQYIWTHRRFKHRPDSMGYPYSS